MNRKVFIDPGKLLQALNGSSSDNPIPASQLEWMLDIPNDKRGHNSGRIRKAISQLERDGHLIGSSPKGFYLITSMLELSKYVQHLGASIDALHNRINWINRAWKHYRPGKTLLKLSQEGIL